MYRIDNATSVAAPPAVPGAGVGGYFTNGNPPVTPATAVDDWWLNMIQTELENVATMDGAALDKTKNDQLKTALTPILGLKTSATDTGFATSTHLRGVCASSSSKASGAAAAVVAGDGVEATGAKSAVVASLSSGGNGHVKASGAESFVGACIGAAAGVVNAAGTAVVILATDGGTSGASIAAGVSYAAILACDDGASGTTISAGANAFIAAAVGCGIPNGTANAVIACEECDAGANAKKASAAIASTDSQAAESRTFVAACSGTSLASGDTSAAVASDGTVVSAGKTFAAACIDATVSATTSAALACGVTGDGVTVAKARSAAIGAQRAKIAAGVGDGQAVLLASQRCELADDFVVAGGYHAATTPTYNGTNQNIKWKIDTVAGKFWATDTVVGGLDYAELFENASRGELPVGRLVELVPGTKKVRLAGGGKSAGLLLGIVSAAPSVVGNNPLDWHGRYKKDAFGCTVVEAFDMVRWPELTETRRRKRKVARAGYDGTIAAAPPRDKWPADAVEYTVRAPADSPDHDPTQPYVPRSERREEWTTVGLLGQLHLCVARDVNPGDWIRPAKDGAGAATDAAGRPPGATVYVMEIAQEFDTDLGYAIALCLVR